MRSGLQARTMERTADLGLPSLWRARERLQRVGLPRTSSHLCAFNKWLDSVHHSTKDITYWIILHFTGWPSYEPFSHAQSNMPGLLQGIDAHDRIGWLAFFKGCTAVKWAGVQEAHFIWLGRSNTGKRWTTSLVVKLWEVACDLWDHRNQVKKNVERARDIPCCDTIMVAVCLEYTFLSRSGLL